MKNTDYDIGIIGGGAAGLSAAVAAAEKAGGRLKIAVFERNDRVGKKLALTGNGRCNITNDFALKNGVYHGDPDFAAAALSHFTVDDTLGFFKKIGIITLCEEDGKRYPLSLQAASVVDQLRFAAAEKKVEFLFKTDIVSVRKDGSRFCLKGSDGANTFVKKLLIAAGGKAAPSTGSGGGYTLLEHFGHRTTRIFPAVVQIKTDTAPIKPLNGIKFNGKITVTAGKRSGNATGEILFTSYGISGPPALHLSRLISENGSGEITLDLIPELSAGQIESELFYRCKAFAPREISELFTGIINKRLGQTVLKNEGILPLSKKLSELSEREIKRAAAAVKSFRLKSNGVRSFENAQVTAGGTDTADFDPLTMRSRLSDGLYAAGEVLNVDGDCGGYNLQWAWSSGYLAGTDMAKALLNTK